jgi:GT2 family glycosyltransferase
MDNDVPLVSVIIVNYNGIMYLDECLSSLMMQTYPAIEIIFVDNGSSDDSVEYVKNNFPFVEIIANKENLGFAKGNNIGIKAAKGDFIATLNNDTKVSTQWMEELAKALIFDENAGICASKMLFMDAPEKINSTGICISRSGACWDRGMFEYDSGQYDSLNDVFGACAGAAMYRKSMLDEIGYFDEDFHAYMEDADLSFRARLSGWKCLYVPNAVVYHAHGGTAGYGSDYTIYYGNRNIIWNSVKNYPTKLLITSLPWIIGRNLAVIPYYILKGHARAILRSKIDALKGIPKILAKRRVCQENEAEILKYLRTWADIPTPPRKQHE